MKEILRYFYTRIHDDGRIGVSHISLYLALVYTGDGCPADSFVINRDAVMQLSKIHSRQTYNRCINDLQEYGYISYSPSSNPVVGSVVRLIL